ncbi:MAG: SDR family NAD(P)-dependent oxidoreductase [Gammaproteobacteria bacterium]|nr:SDR family NAD(P)-dependent oxidoreductase [Gammaproteobacteria bacterium]
MTVNSKLAANQQKTVLVTGCSSGIGRCVALGLQRRGHNVFVTARHETDLKNLKTDGLQAIQLNLNDSDSIHSCVANLLTLTNGRIDVLFNNAAYGQPGAVEDLTRQALRAQLETNLLGTLELTNLLIPNMRQQGFGRIIQNSSVLGLVALPYRGAYNASKYALEGLSDTLRLELKGTGIHVALIEPGPIESQFRANAFAAYKKYIDKRHSPHRDTYLAMEKRLNKKGAAVPFTLPPTAVLRKVIHSIESPRPKIRYYVTFPTYLFATLKRLLPHTVLDWVLLRVSRNEHQ